MKRRFLRSGIFFAASVAMSVATAALAGDDSMEEALQGMTGDAARGRDIVHDRRRGLCVLCHVVPNERFGGDIGPPLAGVGSRMSAGQIRLRIVEPFRANGQTVMPSYFRRDGFVRVGERWRDQPILSAQEIEDAIAYLVTLRD